MEGTIEYSEVYSRWVVAQDRCRELERENRELRADLGHTKERLAAKSREAKMLEAKRVSSQQIALKVKELYLNNSH